MQYADRLRAILTPPERRVFESLNTPQKIQDYLDTLSMNFEIQGETYMSPRMVLREKTAHCFEGALLAAAALMYNGHSPLLLDLQTIASDEDHVITLFQHNGYWGAISKTNHTMLRWRDPVYKTIRELAMSYFHEYVMWDDGRKSLLAYSKPFDLRRFAPERWVTSEENLLWLAEKLDNSRHFPIVPKKNARLLRSASKIELKAMRIVEWKEPN
ncbi:MAG: hypothetical protein UY59_C0009G0010 [Candidatus Kaiserbacteria bacterium GW2011_GWA1_50_28]|uniref:Transglutaminase-like domain-containing protein n=3 Tax=Candidatus Kaiseribacteriota TaxID=1752734 RepID=A0A1F6FPN7_9BACT|nr:MAG: hypothetical protein UY59_C0009G0010 [Candidatus Kaiserbacteria bacterium GW2011_GWA1_50_28]OGG87816.1 MAG: hypothetical protein A3H15_00145 [Candidatus Kaiserbacteria bacterium RIFCSPLOWO2_12_FULL_50_28]HCM43946.1 hypothetical protein [Candidatus Kaiserbacteria bacterium]